MVIFFISGFIPIDITPPVVEIITPKDGDEVSGKVNIKIEAVDNVRVERVELYVNGVMVDEDYYEIG
ncbi:MAG: Ig-like domain-containing protein [Dictyoglomus sp.]|nr:Ig-like domain-containing protein [Dictyoglomus sp.]MDW8188306.1 Ig-like domain-containing protein [Dictyoglomus sp.]